MPPRTPRFQEALLEALRVWPEHPPRDPSAWWAMVATRRLVDARRSEVARHRREEAIHAEPRVGGPGPEEGDDTLFLLFCCCHSELAPATQVALTLRAVGGLTTREIADAFYVPEATMAQRISRAKRTLRGRRPRSARRPRRRAARALPHLHGWAIGRHDLAGEAIRLARQLTLATEEPEARGLLALMLLNHARLPERLDSEGLHRHARPAGPRIVGHPRDRRGRALRSWRWPCRPTNGHLAATRSRPPSPPCTTTRRAPRRPTGLRSSPGTTTSSRSPRTRCGRTRPRCSAARLRSATSSVPRAGLRETDRLREVLGERHRWHAVRAHLHELDGDLRAAAAAYAEAARRATNVAERDHLIRQAARARAAELS